MRIVEHCPRRAQGLRGDWLSDWQADGGACLDKLDQWEPAGATRNEEYGAGRAWHYYLITGMVYVPEARRGIGTHRVVYPMVDGIRYAVTLQQGAWPEIRALKPRALKLKPWSARWRRVADAALRWHEDC